MEWEKLLSSIGTPALLIILVTATVQAYQSRRPQNIIKEMLENRQKADSLALRSNVTSEVLRGLDRLIVLEVSKQLAEKEYKISDDKKFLVNHLMNLYISVFVFAMAMFLLDSQSGGWFGRSSGAYVMYILYLVFIVIYVLIIFRVRQNRRALSRKKRYYKESLLEDSEYHSGIIDAISNRYKEDRQTSRKNGLFFSIRSFLKRK